MKHLIITVIGIFLFVVAYALIKILTINLVGFIILVFSLLMLGLIASILYILYLSKPKKEEPQEEHKNININA